MSDQMARAVHPYKLAPGDTIDDYRITRVIANGGFSVVYEAEDLTLDRLVAIKQLRPEAFTHEDTREWFIREARLTASLTHPNIVNIITLRERGDSLFLVMEYLPGDLHTLQQERGPLDRKTLMAVAGDICRALETLHARNVIHRDIKPENILFAHPQHFKLADFGLAHIHPAQPYGSDDSTGPQPGTLLYMSPEQALGQEVTIQSDIYSLAVVLYEAATGHYYLDYDEATDEDDYLIELITQAEPLPLDACHPTVSRAIEEPLRRALSKHPGDRPRTAREFLNHFRRALRTRRSSSRRRRKAADRVSDRKRAAEIRQELAVVRALRDDGQINAAAAHIRPLLDRYPRVAEVLAEWGETLLAQGQVERGMAIPESVTRQKPALPYAQLALARVYAGQGRLQDASEATIAAIVADPDLAYAVLYDEIVAALAHPTAFVRYVEMFRSAAMRRPSAAGWHNVALVLSLHPDDQAESLAAFREALRLDPAYGPAYVGMGTLLIESGALEQGIAMLEKATQSEFPEMTALDTPKLQTIYQPQHAFLALAIAYIQHGDFESSAAAVRVVMDFAPGELDSDAPELLEAYVQAAETWLAQEETLRAYKFLNQIIPIAAHWGDTRVFALLERIEPRIAPASRRPRQWEDALDWLRSGVRYWQTRPLSLR